MKLSISNFFLAGLLLSVNVNAPDLFYSKEIFFFGLIISSFEYMDFSKALPLIGVSVIYFSSLALNMLVPGSILNFKDGLFYFMGMSYLVLLCFDSKRYEKTVVKYYLISAIVTSLIITIVWILCYVSSSIKDFLFLYSASFESDRVAFLLQISDRKILDWWLPSVYYGTAPCMIPALGYILAMKLKGKSVKLTVCAGFLISALILTGARANILAALLIYFIYLSRKIYLRGNKMMFYFAMMVALISVVMLAYGFMMDKGEASLEVKTLHLESYLNEFARDPVRALMYGWGAGSYFYTTGYSDFTQLTELSIFETIRRYGLFSAFIMILLVWIFPLFKLYGFKNGSSRLMYSASLIMYFFVASTNPFMFGSIGFVALLFFYVIMRQKITSNLLRSI